MNFWLKPAPDNLVSVQAKIPAVRLIDKNMCSIREKPADKFALIPDNSSVLFLSRRSFSIALLFLRL